MGRTTRPRAEDDDASGIQAGDGGGGAGGGPGGVGAAYAGFWILGFGFLWWPVLLLRAIPHCRRSFRPDPWPSAVAALLLLSLVWAVVSGASLGRVAGGAYNLTVWLALVMLTVVRLDVDAVRRGIARLAGLQS